MGLGRFELPTPRLSSVCSDQLSYRPLILGGACGPKMPHRRRRVAGSLKTRQDDPPKRALQRRKRVLHDLTLVKSLLNAEYQIDLECPISIAATCCDLPECSRKEVIQPQVLLQLPCYDFTPITNHTLGACLPCGLARRLLVQPAFVM